MTNAEWIGLISIIMLAGFGSICALLFNMNGTFGEVKAMFGDHERRIKKLEKNTVKLNRAPYKP